MVVATPTENIDREELRELHSKAVEHERYQIDTFISVIKYFTTLNTAVLGGAIALGRVAAASDLSAIYIAFPFFIASLTSFIGYQIIKRVRRYWLQSAVQRVGIAYALGYTEKHSIRENVQTDLVVSWIVGPEGPHGLGSSNNFDSTEDILNNSEEWINENIRQKGGGTYWILNMYIGSALMNLLLGIGILLRPLLF